MQRSPELTTEYPTNKGVISMETKKFSNMYYVNVVVSISLMLLFRYVPAPEPITVYGMTIAGLFIGMVYGWCTTSMIWPSCLALTIFGLSGKNSVAGVWAAAWGSPLIIFIFFLFAISALLSESGLNHYITSWTLSRKFTNGRPWLLIVVIFLGSVISGGVVGPIAAIIIFWSIAQNIFTEIGYKKGDTLPAYVCYGITFLSCLGSMTLPFQTPVVSYFALLFASSNGALTSYNYLSYLLFGLTMSSVAFTAFICIGKYIIKPDVELLANFKAKDSDELVKLDGRQKIGAILFLSLVVLLLAPSFLKPSDNLIVKYVLALGSVGSTALILSIIGFMSYKREPFIRIESLINKGTVWGLVFMLAAALFLAAKLTSPDTGITAYFSSACQPLLSSVGKYGFIFLFMLVTLIATNLINNVAVGAVMIPLSYALCKAEEINPIVILAIFIFIVDFALLLPSSSPVGALLHNNGDWISKERIYRWGALTLTVELLLTVIIGYPLGVLIF